MVTWQWLAYADVSTDVLYEILALRQRVFIVEQNCPYLDADGIDRKARHLLGRNAEGILIAYLRLVLPGARYEEPSIGRVITAPEMRGQGLGRALMEEGIRGVEREFTGQAIRISAQYHLARFYGDLGFRPIGAPYDEDGIPHIQMLWTPVHRERISGMFRLETP